MGYHLFRSLNLAAQNKATKLTDLLSGDERTSPEERTHHNLYGI